MSERPARHRLRARPGRGSVVADTTALITLARIGLLPVLRDLFGIVAVPKAVHRELALGQRSGPARRAGDEALRAAFAEGWLVVKASAARRRRPAGSQDDRYSGVRSKAPSNPEAGGRAGEPPCRSLPEPPSLVVPILGEGESEALALAEALSSCAVLLDDEEAREAARRRGLPAQRTLEVLLAASRSGRIPPMSEVLARCERAGYRVAPGLRAEILERANEASASDSAESPREPQAEREGIELENRNCPE